MHSHARDCCHLEHAAPVLCPSLLVAPAAARVLYHTATRLLSLALALEGSLGSLSLLLLCRASSIPPTHPTVSDDGISVVQAGAEASSIAVVWLTGK